MAAGKKRSSAEIRSSSHSPDEGAAEEAVEEIVEKVEDSVILLRFPCFDFFRNTHICEARPSDRGVVSSTTTGSAEGDGAAPLSSASSKCSPLSEVGQPSSSTISSAEFVFDATLLQVDPSSSLKESHPILVLNKGTDQEMRFVGSWEESEGTMHGALGSGVNRAVIMLRQHRGEDEEYKNRKKTKYEGTQNEAEKSSNQLLSDAVSKGDGARGGPLPTPSQAMQCSGSRVASFFASSDPVVPPFLSSTASSLSGELDGKKESEALSTVSSLRAPMEVASLFSHSQAGVTADDARENKAKVLHSVYTKAIYIPSSVLVLHPLS